MKKSLLIRWLIVAAVILVWLVAIFPVKDADYLAKFKELAAPKIEKLEASAGQLSPEAQAAFEKLENMETWTGEDAQKLKKTLADDPHYADWQAFQEYQELEKRLALLQNKRKFDRAEQISRQMEKLSAEDAEYKTLSEELKAAKESYADWTQTEEYREFIKRLPVALQQDALDKMENPLSVQGKALADAIRKSTQSWEMPSFPNPKARRDYEKMLARLTLILSPEKNFSGFRMLEKAANGNSDLPRIQLGNFIKIRFVKNTANKNVLRYIRVKTAGRLRLGLDLRGGTEFVLGFDENEARGILVDKKACVEFAKSVLGKDAKATAALPEDLTKAIETVVAEKTAVQKEIAQADLALFLVDDSTVSPLLHRFLSEHTEFLTAKPETGSYGSVTEIRDRIINILDNRLNSMGVTEPEIKATGDSSISVRMPSVDEADKNEIRNTIRRAAKLQFFLVSKDNAKLVQEYEADRQNFRTPAGLRRLELENEREDGSVIYEPIFLEAKPTQVKGEDVTRAFPAQNEFGQWRVSLTFNAAGTAAFRTVTHENINRQLAIVLDDKVYSAPNIREGIDGGQAEISGSFTRDEVVRLASVIASGNVPVSVVIDSEFGTDPTLGADSVHSGLLAGLIGLVVVVLFMLWYYRTSGFIAVLALIVNTVLVLGTMAIMKATITMPGIAGMVLTIGMAVDANVIIFERIREELQAGKTVTNAILSGYAKAFSSIFDSNLTTLITCFFLYRYGTGSIKGFAVTLSCGVVSSMFTAIFMTHACFDGLNAAGWIKKLPMRSFHCLTNLNCEILKYRKLFVGISIAFVIASLATFCYRGHNMLGIDFAGGTELSYSCAGGAPNVDAVRQFLEEKGHEGVRVGYKRGQSGDPLLEIVLPSQAGNAKGANVDYTQFSEELDQRFPDVKISLKQTNSVGANVGSQFKRKALVAAVLSLLGVIIYLAFRFEMGYGLGAAIAVIHDGIVSAGLFMMMGGTFSLSVLAAVMTIIGYSLNDTIVIFDRVRETMQERKSMTFYQKMNLAICECMSRTMLTSVTTMFSVIALLCVGGGAIRDFAWVMFFGVITGTYSTIFVACSFVNSWHNRRAAAK